MTNRFHLTTDNATATHEHVAFDNRDAKGRQIGCVADRMVGTFAAANATQTFYEDKWLGTAYTARVEATRDGKRYGSTQRTSIFRTEAEREAFIAKRIAASRKAAAKKEA